MRKIISIVYSIAVCYGYSSFGQTMLEPGDVAIIGYNFKDPDQFSFIFLREAEAGTVIHITDCGYNSSTNTFREGEGLLTFTVPAGGRKMGDIVTYPDDGNFTKQGVNGFFGLTVEGDQLLMFQGSMSSPTFIYALNVYDATWQTASTTNNNTSLPTGLVDGITAVAQSKIVNGKVNCIEIAMEKEFFLKGLASDQNWERSSADRYELPDISCRYTMLAVGADQPVTIEHTPLKIFASGYHQIEIYSIDGRHILTVTSLQEALDSINSENLYIFKVYYPDRLEIRKLIR